MPTDRGPRYASHPFHVPAWTRSGATSFSMPQACLFQSSASPSHLAAGQERFTCCKQLLAKNAASLLISFCLQSSPQKLNTFWFTMASPFSRRSLIFNKVMGFDQTMCKLSRSSKEAGAFAFNQAPRAVSFLHFHVRFRLCSNLLKIPDKVMNSPA